jgi:hypothetical protein
MLVKLTVDGWRVLLPVFPFVLQALLTNKYTTVHGYSISTTGHWLLSGQNHQYQRPMRVAKATTAHGTVLPTAAGTP